MFRLILLISLFLILPATASGDQVLEQKLSKDHESILGFSLWETRKEDIFNKLGETAPLERADSKHDSYRYCYLFDGETDVMLVLDLGWASSFNELTGFSMEGVSEGIDLPGCKPLNRDPFSVKTGSGIYVGMDKESFFQLFPFKLKKNQSNSFSEVFTSYEMTECLPLEGGEEHQQEGIFWYYSIDAEFEGKILRRYYLSVGGEPDSVVTHSCSETLRMSWPALFRTN